YVSGKIACAGIRNIVVVAMPDILEIMGTARSMRYLKTDPVPSELIDKLMWAATRASNPSNVQPWDFVVVQDPAVRTQIGELLAPRLETPPTPPDGADASLRRSYAGAIHLIAHLADAPVIIFVCGTNNYPPHAPNTEFMYSAIYAAAQNLLVAARGLGLGAAFTTLHGAMGQPLRDLLAIPEDRHIGVTIPVGWPARPFGSVNRKPVADVVHH